MRCFLMGKSFNYEEIIIHYNHHVGCTTQCVVMSTDLACNISLIHLTSAIARAHASTGPLVWCMLKVVRATSVYDTYCLGYRNDENEGTITSNLIVDHFLNLI